MRRKRGELISLVLGLSALGWAVPAQSRSTEAGDLSPQEGRHALSMGLSVSLVNPQGAGMEKAATVQVNVTGVDLTDPDSARESPVAGQGHLHYELDNNPAIATTATKLSFHDLEPGSHSITVKLVGNDHRPLGPQETVMLTIP